VISRRAFVGSLTGSLLAAEAQPAGKVYRVGFLRDGQLPETFVDGFRQGLRDLGYVEGQSIKLECGLARTAEDLPATAARLVNLKVDVILASGTPPVPVAKSATKAIPIVFVAAIDPVATGVVVSPARPGGNVTGIAGIPPELLGKRLQLLGEAVHKLSRVAVLSQATHPGNTEYITARSDRPPA